MQPFKIHSSPKASPRKKNTSPISISFLPQSPMNEITPISTDNAKRIQDLTIINKDLITELESLNRELVEKDKLIDFKTRKINDLMHDNNKLLSLINNERTENEQNFEDWIDLKTTLELKIHRLEKQLNVSGNILSFDNNDDQISQLYENLQLAKTEITKLKKKNVVLIKETELEVQSKMMIMEELEMMRARYLEVDEKFQSLQLEYDELANDFLISQSNLGEEDDEEGYDDFDYEGESQTGKLNIKKKRVSSRNSSTSSRISSLRNNSLNKAYREAELSVLKQKYELEIKNHEFEIVSLKLQCEKLLSFIGYLTPQAKNGSSSGSGSGSNSNISFSDSHNIKNAQKALKHIMKSVSTMEMRKSNSTGKPIFSQRSVSTHAHKINRLQPFVTSQNHLRSDDEQDCDFIDGNNSIDYSTDYNQGEVERLDFDASDISDVFGDDELDFDEDKDFDDYLDVPRTFNNVQNFPSTSSLNCVYNMNLTPDVNIIEEKKVIAERKHIKRLTPSTFNLFNKAASESSSRESFSDHTNERKSLHDIYEEEESDYNEQFSTSEEEDDEDGDEDETFNISNQEIEMFKIDLLRKFYCPKHSMFQCFCKSLDIKRDSYFAHSFSPLYSIYKIRQTNAKSNSLNSLKLRNKMATNSSNSNSNNNSTSTLNSNNTNNGNKQPLSTSGSGNLILEDKENVITIKPSISGLNGEIEINEINEIDEID